MVIKGLMILKKQIRENLPETTLLDRSMNKFAFGIEMFRNSIIELITGLIVAVLRVSACSKP